MMSFIKFPSPYYTWMFAIIVFGSIQSLAFSLLQTERPRYTWIFLFLQCGCSYLFVIPGRNAFLKRPTWKIVRQSLLYTIYIVLPQIAFFVSPKIGSITLCTALRSSAITMNLIIRRERSIIQWYGAIFVNIGLFYLLFVLAWPASAFKPILGNPEGITYLVQFVWQTQMMLWHNVIAIILIAISVLAGVLLGIDQELAGRDDFFTMFLTCSLLVPFVSSDIEDFFKEMFWKALQDNNMLYEMIVIHALMWSSAILTFAIREFAQGTKNDSYTMAYVSTVRRFVTVIIGAFLFSEGERNTILLAMMIMTFGIAINEMYFVVERRKLERREKKKETSIPDAEKESERKVK